jgi:type II secretory pathway pseudopilin PulG
VNRRGFALLATVAALTVLGVITATGLALAIREAALGRSALADATARAAAEGALAEAFRGWNRGTTPVLPGDSLALAPAAFSGGVTGQAVVHALGGPILALRATGVVSGPGGAVLGKSRIERLIRVDSAGSDSLFRPRFIGLGWRLIP